uniref:Carrier domain-containing protein n=1 Tax=Aureoumbra lagunensis TaxID=44058 RepID=A0A7S3NL32_9STRA|mmetsp:Transcript_16971/g.21992  ORF Transcript_16971/g.21992 Transcript_16971/m.21992 type:complete len:1046 (+) Transcript_16971:189-3326(+)|eukprot:CAMPEP_0197288196 /NCGR_PEP_ID=MMETSP0890-20130614/5189_1 /TAXON_ID=44058 ORGANISM="Aureoumbra lagunensis, Strain CCMP1510" /NCGR_SAMPLE_ID=MMETSP0890 /ASSEMBLY_ACC=CAM_ASM_000533 /LENGTH=1045 /DNA_ID=CAMNT_0042758711 /DNA_START=79 /DNA_END=3216 /DNA_ORIENTATION=-
MKMMKAAKSWNEILEIGLSDNYKSRTAVEGADNQVLTFHQIVHLASVLQHEIIETTRDTMEKKLTIALVFPKSSIYGIVSTITALLSGFQFVEIPSNSEMSEMSRVLKLICPDVVLSDQNHYLQKKKLSAIGISPIFIAVDKLLENGKTQQKELLSFNNGWNHDDGVYCIMTSGTTSLSKIVMLPTSALICASSYFEIDMNNSESFRVGLFWIQYYMFAVWNHGGTVVLLNEKAFVDMNIFLRSVLDQQLDAVFVTPSIISACLDSVSEQEFIKAFALIKVIWFTGESVTIQLRRRLNNLLPQLKVISVYSTMESGDIAICRDETGIFKPLPNVSLKIVDPNDSSSIVPLGEIGAIHVLTKWSMIGYFTDETQFIHKVSDDESVDSLASISSMSNVDVSSPILTKKNTFFRTGDLVKRGEQDNFEFVAREANAHVKVIGGFKVFPQIIESLLMRHPQIEFALCGTTDISSGRLEATVSIRDDTDLPSSNDLRAFLLKDQGVPRYAVPTIFRCAALPNKVATAQNNEDLYFSTTGKKKQLSQIQITRILEQSPLLDTERTKISQCTEHNSLHCLSQREIDMAKIWADVLSMPLDAISSADMNFFDLGGSLNFVKLKARLGIEFNVPPQIIDKIIEVPTLRNMVAALTGVQSDINKNETKDETPAEHGRRALLACLNEDLHDITYYNTVLAACRGIKEKRILVTGCTGYVGAYMTRCIAEQPNVTVVYALVRADDDSTATSRLYSILSKRGIINQEKKSWWNKVICIAGDITEPYLGLRSSARDMPVHGIIHAAAEVNMLKSKSALEAPNIFGCANAIAFARLQKSPLVFTSTILPVGNSESTGYRASKEVAEHICAIANEKYGVPINVLQLGDIGIGDDLVNNLSDPAAVLPPDDYIIILLRACILIGKIPERSDWSISILNVDAIARFTCDTLIQCEEKDFDAKPQEIKGDLFSWKTFCDWLLSSSLRNSLSRCDYQTWVNSIDKTANQANEICVKLRLLLPSIEQEFIAENNQRLSGKGSNGVFTIDPTWISNLALALSASISN